MFFNKGLWHNEFRMVIFALFNSKVSVIIWSKFFYSKIELSDTQHHQLKIIKGIIIFYSFNVCKIFSFQSQWWEHKNELQYIFNVKMKSFNYFLNGCLTFPAVDDLILTNF